MKLRIPRPFVTPVAIVLIPVVIVFFIAMASAHAFSRGWRSMKGGAHGLTH